MDPGSKLQGEHYGFAIKISDGESTDYVYRTCYKTQRPIASVTTINGKICIFEKDKDNPWVVTGTGKVVQAATFNPFVNAEYLKELGITDAEQTQRLNQEAKQEIDEAKREKIKRPVSGISKYMIR